MANLPRVNYSDPVIQEEIRRGTHEYVPTAGKHGEYRPKNWVPTGRGPLTTYEHEEYPKMMLKTPRPQYKDFRRLDNGDFLYDEAVKEWDIAMSLSIVNDKAEEEAWLKQAAANEQKALEEAKEKAEEEKRKRATAREDLLEGFRELAKVAAEEGKKRSRAAA